MENIIYNDLIRRGYSVDVGVVVDRRNGANTQKEVDFVVNDGDKSIGVNTAVVYINNLTDKRRHGVGFIRGDGYADMTVLFRCHGRNVRDQV